MLNGFIQFHFITRTSRIFQLTLDILELSMLCLAGTSMAFGVRAKLNKKLLSIQ